MQSVAERAQFVSLADIVRGDANQMTRVLDRAVMQDNSDFSVPMTFSMSEMWPEKVFTARMLTVGMRRHLFQQNGETQTDLFYSLLREEILHVDRDIGARINATSITRGVSSTQTCRPADG